jgi:hypothetical protein
MKKEKSVFATIIMVALAMLLSTGCATSNKAIAQALPAVAQQDAAAVKATTKAAVATLPAIANSSAQLSASDVKFHDNWKDAGKPQKGAFAAKWWNGKKAQIMCYNDESESTLPASLKAEMLKYLSENRPDGTEADKENPQYKLFLATDMTFPETHVEKAISSTAPTDQVQEAQTQAPVAAAVAQTPQACPDAKLKADLDALKARLAAAEAAEAQRLADAKTEADKRAKEAEAAAKAKAEKDRRARAVAAAKALDDQYMKKLAKLGYEGEKAVSEFQEAAELETDGKLGPKTRRMIDKALAAQEDCTAKKIGGKDCDDAQKAAVATAKPAEPAPAPATPAKTEPTKK